MKNFLFIIILLVPVSCEKVSIDRSSDNYIWVNSKNANDILEFKNDSIFTKSGYDGIQSFFRYTFKKDSITIQYTGPNKILVPPVTNYFTLDKEKLILYLINCAYAFECTKIVYIKQH